MLVATPGQTSYSIVHNSSSSNGSGGNSAAAATTAAKKSSTLNSANIATVGVAKSLNNNSNHTTVTTKNSLNSNTHTATYSYHPTLKSDNSVAHKVSNQSKAAASAITSSREIISSALKMAVTTHSSKNENSTNNNNTTTTNTIKQQSFIQSLKDSVQKALISTTGSSSKYASDNKLQNNCNNSSTSMHNVISSSSAATQNANKVSTTTTSVGNSTASTALTQSSSSAAATTVRGKYSSCSLAKLHTVAPTVIHRNPEERQNANSTDSLQKEMCHFKPIRAVPKTPYKSGSKSRGNGLRFPKAKRATTNTESVLKSNCDVNNRKRKQQQQQQNRKKIDQITAEDADVDDHEQENKEFRGIYKPKPSLTCLTTSFNTPNRRSAFVYLASNMKGLTSSASVVNLTSVANLKELYVRKNKKPVKRQKRQTKDSEKLSRARSIRLSSSSIVKNMRASTETATQTSTKERTPGTNAKISNISKASTQQANMGRSKSKTTNVGELTNTKAKEKLRNSLSMPAVIGKATVSRRAKKRKVTNDDDAEQPPMEPLAKSLSSTSPSNTTSVKSLSLGVRKSSRISTRRTSSNANTNLKSHLNARKSSHDTRKKPPSVARSSPPLTRSRLKQLAELGKIVTSANEVIRKHRT